MRRTIRPDLELLETKALLSATSSPIPGLVDTLSAVASRTLAGAQVAETLTVTNVSNHDITVDHGPGNEGFTVTQAGKTVYNPYAGPIPQFLQSEVLKPHQSLTITGTWDGRSNVANPANPGQEGPTLSGTFTVSNGLDASPATATVTIPAAWTVPVKRTHIEPPKLPAQAAAPPHVAPIATAGLKLNPAAS